MGRIFGAESQVEHVSRYRSHRKCPYNFAAETICWGAILAAFRRRFLTVCSRNHRLFRSGSLFLNSTLFTRISAQQLKASSFVLLQLLPNQTKEKKTILLFVDFFFALEQWSNTPNSVTFVSLGYVDAPPTADTFDGGGKRFTILYSCILLSTSCRKCPHLHHLLRKSQRCPLRISRLLRSCMM